MQTLILSPRENHYLFTWASSHYILVIIFLLIICLFLLSFPCTIIHFRMAFFTTMKSFSFLIRFPFSLRSSHGFAITLMFTTLASTHVLCNKSLCIFFTSWVPSCFFTSDLTHGWAELEFWDWGAKIIVNWTNLEVSYTRNKKSS